MTAPTEEIKVFYHAQVEQALQNCQEERYQAQFMPQVAGKRINGILPWNFYVSTPSIQITGRTKQGSPVVVYAHILTSLATAEGIKKAKKQGLVKGAFRFPQEEFQQLVNTEGQTDAQGNCLVWVVDYEILKKSKSGQLAITNTLEHPQTIPFLGGRTRAEHYLVTHMQEYNAKEIGVWHDDDLDEDSPLARLLYLGDDAFHGLFGYDFVAMGGQFLGVRNIISGNTSTQNLEESIETIGDRHIQALAQSMRQRGYRV